MPHLNNFYDEKTIKDIFNLINKSDEENFYIHDMLMNRIQANDIMGRMYMSFTMCILTFFNMVMAAYVNNDIIMWGNLIVFIGSLISFMMLTHDLKKNGEELDELILSKRKRAYERNKN